MDINIDPTPKNNPIAGANNLLKHCLGVEPGQSLLIVLEQDEQLYARDVGLLIEGRARDLGATVTVLNEPLIQHAADFPESVSSVMRTVDHTLFLSRLGDYVRFVELPGRCTKFTSYTFDIEQLGSPYATVSHTLLALLRDKLEQELLAATSWHITCPLGTDLKGTFQWASLDGGEDDELMVGLFPVSTFKPIACHTANGQVALSRWLMPGGAPKIESPGLDLTQTVFCEINGGMIQRFTGGEDAERVSTHYDRVASLLQLNRNRVHSWHLGINPQTYFPTDANLDLEKWCAMSFASPRYLHFHTCGDEPPGEVAWSLFNCTVRVDGELFWENGQFNWLNRADNRALITQSDGADVLLDTSCEIGI